MNKVHPVFFRYSGNICVQASGFLTVHKDQTRLIQLQRSLTRTGEGDGRHMQVKLKLLKVQKKKSTSERQAFSFVRCECLSIV